MLQRARTFFIRYVHTGSSLLESLREYIENIVFERWVCLSYDVQPLLTEEDRVCPGVVHIAKRGMGFGEEGQQNEP